MIKIKILSYSKIDPSVNQKGQIEFTFADCYVCEKEICLISMPNAEPELDDGWITKSIKDYCKNNDLRLCNVYYRHNTPTTRLVVVDDTIKRLIETLD